MIEPDSYQNRDDSDWNAKRIAETYDDAIVNLIAGGLLGAVGGGGLGFSVSLAFTGWAVVAFFVGGVAGGVFGMVLVGADSGLHSKFSWRLATAVAMSTTRVLRCSKVQSRDNRICFLSANLRDDLGYQFDLIVKRSV